MSIEFVYCPSCGTHQTKIGDGKELMFCQMCTCAWEEPRALSKSKKKKKKKKKEKAPFFNYS